MNYFRLIYIVLTTFFIVIFLVPYVKKLATYVGAIDIPNKRKVHSTLIPRMGGLAIFIGFLVGYMIFSEPRIDMISIIIGSFIIVITGIFDDISGLPPKVKLLMQIVAASVVVFYGGILLDKFYIFNTKLELYYLAYPLTILWIVSIINAINLIDGLDGLAAGISTIYFITIATIAIAKGDMFTITLSLIMLGSTFGFLRYNTYPASIFMGDTGSMFLGFIISTLALFQFRNATVISLIVPMLILAVPILDTLFAIIRRLIKKESITKADKQHLHHQFLNWKFSHKNTVIIIYLISISFSVIALIFSLYSENLGYMLFIIASIVVFIFAKKTNILSIKNNSSRGGEIDKD